MTLNTSKFFQYINGFYNPAPTALSIGLEKPDRLRTERCLNEHLERHENATRPNLYVTASKLIFLNIYTEA